MTLSDVAADLQLPRRGLTRLQYDALIDAGMLDDSPVELLEGVLADVVPQGPEHSWVVSRVTRHLVPRLGEPWNLRVQAPLAVDEHSPTTTEG